MDEFVNKFFLSIAAILALLFLHSDKYKFKSIISVFFVGVAAFTIGIFLFYLFHDISTLTEQKIIKKVTINSKFILVGYACIFSAALGSIVYILKVLVGKEP